MYFLVIPFQHFHKKWARRVKTWLDQPAQKRIRRERRKVKAAQLSPKPSSGSLRPLVQCPTQKYNTKVRQGRGFTIEELKGAGFDPKYAQTVGIAVDHRRTNKSEESLKLNIQRLKDYKARLVVVKKGKTTDVPQLTGEIAAPAAAKNSAVSFIAKSELEGLQANKAYAALRSARTEARLVGIREKQAKVEKDEKKPAAAGDD
jgi:large subunit ribosomal protein L13e